MSDYPKILEAREASSMVSVWNRYLRLDKNGDGTAKLEICRYEALAEIEFDENGKELPLPQQIDDKTVVGVEDDYIVGGSLNCYDDKTFIYDSNKIDDVIAWLKTQMFKVNNNIVTELRNAVI